jgi:FkbM family methyltransferase
MPGMSATVFILRNMLPLAWRQQIRTFVPARTPAARCRQELLRTKIRQDEIAIDCGANVGDIAEHLSRYGGTVFCFEPNPFAFEHLQNRFLSSPNVICIPSAVHSANSRMKLHLHNYANADELSGSNVSSLLGFKNNVSQDRCIEVQVIDLCEFIQNLALPVRVLKLDVEGVEGPILKKLIETGVVNMIERIFVETHERKIPEIVGEIEEIRSLINQKDLKNINLDWV